MRYKLLIPLTVTLLVGCSSKEERQLMQHYHAQQHYHKQLQKSEKLQLYNNQVTAVVMSATYLNGQVIDRDQHPLERFVVAIYSDEEREQGVLEGEGYRLTLNGKAPQSIEPIDTNDSVVASLSFVSEWSGLYRVTFPHIPKKSLTLTLESTTYGKGSLHFAKVAKYVLTKKPF